MIFREKQLSISAVNEIELVASIVLAPLKRFKQQMTAAWISIAALF
jgi:hypothetical protein